LMSLNALKFIPTMAFGGRIRPDAKAWVDCEVEPNR
jgi:hypothetical protein